MHPINIPKKYNLKVKRFVRFCASKFDVIFRLHIIWW